jgi:hypothetical protein
MTGWQPVSSSWSAAERREALYAGALLHGPPTPSSRALVALAQGMLEQELGPAPREAVHHLPSTELFLRLGRVRRALFDAREAHALLFALLAEHGDDPAAFAVDPVRLRIVHPHGHREPAARAAYAVHRDVWYAHPAALITWWIPLFDQPESTTFSTWPALFDVAVDNDSARFDYADWLAEGSGMKIGWQDPKAGLTMHYPSFLGPREALGDGVGFSCARAENRWFAGAHLHGTRPHETSLSRFSLDFRIVHREDKAAGHGAPLVDDGSRGAHLREYLWFGVDGLRAGV